MSNSTVVGPIDDLIERAEHEINEDLRIASLMRQPHNRETLMKRAAVTQELVDLVQKLRNA